MRRGSMPRGVNEVMESSSLRLIEGDEGPQYASLVGGIGDLISRLLIGLGALLLVAVVGILAIALALLFLHAVT